MLFIPANLANALRNRGIPIARGQLKKRQSGAHVFTAGGVMLLEWKDYAETGAGQLETAAESLRGMGYSVSQIGPELYKVEERAAGGSSSGDSKLAEPTAQFFAEAEA